MVGRVFLHVGLPKTGTTFLQRVMWSQKKLVRAQGSILPLESVFEHYLASVDVRGLAAQQRHPARANGQWQRLVTEVEDWSGDVIISHELFAAANEVQADRAVSSFRGREVHVIVTARDLARQIPAEWQESVKHRYAKSFEHFIDDVRHDPDHRTWFWRVQNVTSVVRRWSRDLPPEQVHVVTVPPSGAAPAVLWSRFATTVGLTPEPFELSVARANPSLSCEQAELVRRLNQILGDRLPRSGVYPRLVKEILSHSILSKRPGTPLVLPRSSWEFAHDKSMEIIEGLHSLGVNVVGDLHDLIPRELPYEQATSPSSVETDRLLDESLEAIIGLLRWIRRQEGARVDMKVPKGKETA